MRYSLVIAVLALFFVFAGMGESQDIKKKPKDDKPAPPVEISDFAGKSFEQWRKDLHHIDPSEREVAFRAIVEFPLAKVYTALPDILKELKKHTKDSPVDLSVPQLMA